MRRRWLDDDDDLDAFEPRYLAQGKQVYKDGYGPRVPVMLMDGMPDRMPPRADRRRLGQGRRRGRL
jgi:hypothetical protein